MDHYAIKPHAHHPQTPLSVRASCEVQSTERMRGTDCEPLCEVNSTSFTALLLETYSFPSSVAELSLMTKHVGAGLRPAIASVSNEAPSA